MNDIDKAIASAAAQQRQVTMVEIPITIAGSGRPAVIAVPVDLTESELLEIIGWLAVPGGIRRTIEAQRSPIVAARSIPRIES